MALNFEEAQRVGRIKLKVGKWTGASQQVLDKANNSIVRAFNKTRKEMETWINREVPIDLGTLRLSGIEVINRGASKRFLPAEIWYGFPAETRYVYKTGERKGRVSIFKYANYVNAKSGPGKKGGRMPFINRGLQALKLKLKSNLRREFGNEFDDLFVREGLAL